MDAPLTFTFLPHELSTWKCLLDSVFGDGSSTPSKYRPVEDAGEHFRERITQALEKEYVVSTEITLPEHYWIQIAALATDAQRAVLNMTWMVLQPSLNQIEEELEQRNLVPTLKPAPIYEEHHDQVEDEEREDGYDTWLFEPRAPGFIPSIRAQSRELTISSHEEGALREAVYLYDAGEALIRSGLKDQEPHQVLTGLASLLRLDLAMAEQALIGGRPRPSLQQTLTSLKYGESWKAGIIVEGLRQLATRAKAIGQPMIAHELEKLVFELAHQWIRALERRAYDEDIVRHVAHIPRKVLMDSLEKEWERLSYEERIERLAKAFMFPVTHQRCFTDETLADWERTVLGSAAAWMGRDRLRREMAADVYRRAHELADCRVWDSFAYPIFKRRWKRDGPDDDGNPTDAA